MKFVKTIAIAATLFAGVSAANAASFNNATLNLGAVQSATGGTVLTLNETEAKLVSYDNDVTQIRAQIKNNPALLANIEAQGFTLDQIVGATGGRTDLTLYAL